MTNDEIREKLRRLFAALEAKLLTEKCDVPTIFTVQARAQHLLAQPKPITVIWDVDERSGKIDGLKIKTEEYGDRQLSANHDSIPIADMLTAAIAVEQIHDLILRARDIRRKEETVALDRSNFFTAQWEADK